MKMYKLFLIISFTLLLSAKIFGQAAVEVSLIATAGAINIPLVVGLDLNATNCIDPQLGESEAPPIPPGYYLEVRFDLDPYGCPLITCYKDCRAPGNPPAFPFTGMIEHTLVFDGEFLGSPLDITYNLLPGITMTIKDQLGGFLLNLGPFTGYGTTTIPGSYTSLFIRALILMEYSDITPVEITSFTASVLQNEKAVQLNWTTATEKNNSGFAVEKKPIPNSKSEFRNSNWTEIGFVPGFGTTTEQKSYSFIDDLSLTPNLTHTVRYRLKQIDFDGSFTYSNEIEVEVDFTPKEFVLYQNYPNPFNSMTMIEFSLPEDVTNVKLSIYNMLGEKVAELVNTLLTAGNYQYQWNAINLATGIFIYELRSDKFMSVKKMVLIK